MKKLFFFLMLTITVSLFSQQEPIYLSCYGGYIHEFSETGRTRDVVMPYIQNGRLYFFSIGLPVIPGNLRSGFKIYLQTNSNELEAIAIYNGRQTDKIESKDTPLLIAGYAESKKIVITHVFFDLVSLENWTKTVKTAHY